MNDPVRENPSAFTPPAPPAPGSKFARNRPERRALEKWREKRPSLPKGRPPEVAPEDAATREYWEDFATNSYCDFGEEEYLHQRYLARWAEGRAALFENPALAVSRVLALAKVAFLATIHDRFATRLRAAGILSRYGAEPPPSKEPAAPDKIAAATRLLLRLQDLTRAAPRVNGEIKPDPELGEDIYAELLAADGRSPRALDEDLAGLARYAALAEFINVILFAAWDADGDLALRAARAVLRMTGPLFRQVGYGQPARDLDGEEQALLEYLRLERAEARTPWIQAPRIPEPPEKNNEKTPLAQAPPAGTGPPG